MSLWLVCVCVCVVTRGSYSLGSLALLVIAAQASKHRRRTTRERRAHLWRSMKHPLGNLTHHVLHALGEIIVTDTTKVPLAAEGASVGWDHFCGGGDGRKSKSALRLILSEALLQVCFAAVKAQWRGGCTRGLGF